MFLLYHTCSVAKSCPMLWDPVDCSLPGFSVHGILQARIQEWVAFPPPGNLPWPRIEPVFPAYPALAGGFFTTLPGMVECYFWKFTSPHTVLMPLLWFISYGGLLLSVSGRFQSQWHLTAWFSGNMLYGSEMRVSFITETLEHKTEGKKKTSHNHDFQSQTYFGIFLFLIFVKCIHS